MSHTGFMVWIDIKWIPRRTTKISKQFHWLSDASYYFYIFCKLFARNPSLACIRSHPVLCMSWCDVKGRGSLKAQPQGVLLCLWDKQTLGLKTRPGLHRWDEKQGKGHICHQLDANVQMFSRLFFFRMINKHVGGMKEKSAHFQTSLSTSHTFPQSGSDVRCPTPSSHKNTSKLIWKWRQWKWSLI